MFDIGGSELLLIGIVALIVVGPKDLPKMFHALGQFTAKARQMAREFQRAMENAADEAGAGDVARDLKSLNSLRNLGTDTLNEATRRLESWEEAKRASVAGLQPDPDAMPPAPAATPAATPEAAPAETAAADASAAAPVMAEPAAASAKPAPKKAPAKAASKAPAKSTAKAPAKAATKTATKTASKAPAKPKAASKTGTKTAAKASKTPKNGEA